MAPTCQVSANGTTRSGLKIVMSPVTISVYGKLGVPGNSAGVSRLLSRSNSGAAPRLPSARLLFTVSVTPGLFVTCPAKSVRPRRVYERLNPARTAKSPGLAPVSAPRNPLLALGVQAKPTLGEMLFQSIG